MRSQRGPVDLVLIMAVVLLLGLGAFMVYSASLVVAHNEFQDDTYFLSRQVTWIAVGLVAMAFLAMVDYHHWQRFSLLFLLVGIVLLIVVLVPGLGHTSYGSSRWLRIGPIQIQPSEIIKLALVLYMADWLARKGRRVSEFFYSSLPFLIILGLICFLVVIEPDLGTTVVIALTATSIFFIAGANPLQFVATLGLMGAAGWWAISHAGWRSQRIVAWLDPWQDSQGAGWHTIQTLIALGSGGLTGLGLGASRQKHYWLVNAHTDAILAIVGEELGLIGTLGVLLLFGMLIWRGLKIGTNAVDSYGRLLAAGIVTKIFWQAAINVAVVTNTVPYTGVTLPFVSFGGNSTVVALASVGLLLSVARHRKTGTVWVHGQAGAEGANGTGLRGRRPRERPAAEPTVAAVGRLETPIPIPTGRGPNFGKGRGRVG